LWLSKPEVPAKVTDCEAEAVLVVAEKVMVSGVPGVTVMGIAETVTPAGSPVICIETAEEKPFNGVTDKDVVAEPPEPMEMVEGVTVNSKSGVGGGELPAPPLLPPHPQKISTSSSAGVRLQRGHKRSKTQK